MKKAYEIAGQVMGHFEAFKGSKPAIDNDKILIVRGKSRRRVPLDELDSELEKLGQEIGGKEIDKDSNKVEEILKSGDKHIQETEVTTETVDNKGFAKMKESLELMGLVVEYKIFELPSHDVVVAIWEDKAEIPPLYVEVTVSERDE